MVRKLPALLKGSEGHQGIAAQGLKQKLEVKVIHLLEVKFWTRTLLQPPEQVTHL